MAHTEFGDAGVTTLAIGGSGCDLAEKFGDRALLAEVAECLTASVDAVALAEGDHLVCNRLESLSFGEGGLNLAVLDETAGEVGKQAAAMLGLTL